ncbi:MAG TPA: FtsX-like permease family protein [Saprospiraceae bacterium]|nr:FtsX-like permease family protein [Saprospiraceae bacterium]
MNLLKLSWKNLTNKPLTMLLSIVLFALGVGLISLLFLLENQLQKNFEKNLAGIDLVIGAKGSPLQMILSSMYHIDAPTGNISLGEIRPFLNPKHPLIETAIPLSMGDSYRGYRILGTEPKILDLYGVELARGELWKRNFEATVGASVATELGLEIGDEFSSSHGFTDNDDFAHDLNFRVVGILEPSGTVMDQLILCTTQSFWLVHEHEMEIGGSEESEEEHDDHASIPQSLTQEPDDKEITSLLIKFKGRNFQALNMQRSINENTDLQAATPAIEINRLFSLMDTGEQALRVLAVVIIFVSGLSVFISLFSSLKDRKYELALMRVMGASPRKLFSLIVLEGLLLALLGFVVGILLSHGGMQLFAGAMQEAYRYTFSGLEFLREEVYLFFGALGIGFLAAILPAIRAASTDISETLSEG